MKRVPDFLIIGGMKCMTSTLHEQLARQPGFCMSEPKEPFYFSNDEVYAKGADWYADLWKDQAPGDLCGESSTHYAKLPTYPHTIDRMLADCPDAKLIYIMRHPIDRLRSQYVHEWTMTFVTDGINEAIDSWPVLVDYSRYAYQVEAYLKAFGPGRVLPMFFDRLRAHPQAELERACAFLGYEGRPEWVEDLGAQNVGAERMRESPLRDFVTELPGLSWVRRTLVPQSLRDRVKGLWQMKAKPELSDARVAELTATFDADLARLSDWLGLDAALTCENFKATTAELVPTWRDGVAESLATEPADAPTDEPREGVAA